MVLLIGGGLAYNQFKDNRATTGSTSSDTQSGNYINLNPPTDQEKKDAEENKKSLAEEPSPPSPTANGKKQVTPEISSATRSEVRAFVSGIFEDGGTCTATATKAGESSITAAKKGFKNVSYTQCEPIIWSLPDSGWVVVVSYSSNTAEGQSESQIVN